MENKRKILVVDDERLNRLLMNDRLSPLGYEVLLACDGMEALEVVEKEKPDLILLDIMMPNMDGFEVAKRIKGCEETKSIPIVMVTSLRGLDDRIRALESGADDFLSKPVNSTELKARVSSLIKVKEYHDRIIKKRNDLEEMNRQLEKAIVRANDMAFQAELARRLLLEEQEKVTRYAQDMERLANERAEQLVHADRMATLGAMSAGIAHEINNPTTFISGNAQTLEIIWPIMKDVIQQRLISVESDESDQLKFILEEMPGIISGIRIGASRITRIVNGLKFFAHQDKPRSVPCEINILLEEALLLCKNVLKYNITVEKQFSENLPQVTGDPQQIEQVFINLITNAANAMEETEKGELLIKSKIVETNNPTKRYVEVRIEDNGPGISDDAISKIWNPFYTTKPIGKGTGLGLSISFGIVENHSGKIKAENKPDGGAAFTVLFPALDLLTES